MRIPNEETIELLRRAYPAGCRVVLDFMDDPAAPPVGTQGTVIGIDVQASVMVNWDNGSGLNVTEVDRIHKIRTEDEAVITLNWYGVHQQSEDSYCPRCGDMMWGPTARHALSRYAQIFICDRCGIEESLECAGIVAKRPLIEWCCMMIPSIDDVAKVRGLD